MNDGGKWIFATRGNVQPFERVERYKAGRIRDRFTDELLEEYCQAFLKIEPSVMTLTEARWRLDIES
jgi:hypothetical protein